MPVSYRGVPTYMLGSFTVANAPTKANTPTLAAGDTAYFTNALKAAETTGTGPGNMGYLTGSAWRRVDTGAAIGA